MKKKFIALGVAVGAATIAASTLAYGVFTKPHSSEELAAKAVIAMSNVKSFDIDGNMDASASVGSLLSVPANVTFDGNYNIAESTGLINYTAKATILGQDLDYSDKIDLTYKDEEDSSTEATTETTETTEMDESTEETIAESINLLENSEFNYDKENKTYSITLKVEDIVKLEAIEEMLLGDDSVLKQIGITEEQFYAALNDDANVKLTFNNNYYLSEISIGSMDIEKDIDLGGLGVANVPAKAAFETDIHFTNYL